MKFIGRKDAEAGILNQANGFNGSNGIIMQMLSDSGATGEFLIPRSPAGSTGDGATNKNIFIRSQKVSAQNYYELYKHSKNFFEDTPYTIPTQAGYNDKPENTVPTLQIESRDSLFNVQIGSSRANTQGTKAIPEQSNSKYLGAGTLTVSKNNSIYDQQLGRNYPSATKFGAMRDNLRLTSSTYIQTGQTEAGPMSSISLYGYNYYNTGDKDRETVGGAAIVLEPSGNSFTNLKMKGGVAGATGPGQTPYRMSFYIKSGGGTGATGSGNVWDELDPNNDDPIMTLTNDKRVNVYAPVKWHTNPQSQKGPAILDTEEQDGPAGGYRKAEFQGAVNHNDIMIWDETAGLVEDGLINLLLQLVLVLCNMNTSMMLELQDHLVIILLLLLILIKV